MFISYDDIDLQNINIAILITATYLLFSDSSLLAFMKNKILEMFGGVIVTLFFINAVSFGWNGLRQLKAQSVFSKA